MVGSSTGGGVLASATYQSEAGPELTPLRRLRPGCILSSPNALQGTVMGLPTALQSVRSLYTSAAADASLICTAHAPARAYLLWPALQAPQNWLTDVWVPVRGAEVKMRWAGFSLKQRAWLNITNQRRTYEEQPLLLYTLASNRGVLPAGAQLQLPPLNADERCLQDTPCGLHVPAVVVLCSARGDASKQGLAAAAMPRGSDSSSIGPSMQLLDQIAGDLTACTLEDIFSALEEGMFDAASLSRDAADVLLHRSMAAGDDELLLMLVQADVCLHCSQLSLQELLSYACKHDLAHLADSVLCCTTVELTQPELMWLVGTLVASKNMFDAERLLAGYVLTRRNALSSTAAVEYALIKAATAGFVPNQDALQLAMRFRSAKHVLLQQLIQRYADDQKGCATVGHATITPSLDAGSMQSQLTMVGGSGHYNKHGTGPLTLLDPLLHTVKLCLVGLAGHTIGRGGGAGRASIHDSSPYSMALSLGDAEFLGMQPVRDYTRLIWHGLELHRMRRVTWMAVASAEEAAAEAGPFSSKHHSKHQPDLAALEHDSDSSSVAAVAGSSTSKWAARVSRGYNASNSLAASSGRATTRHAAVAGRSPAAAAADSCWMDPHVGYDLLQNLGLAGGMGSRLARVGATLLHGVLLAPRALHDSSWGRFVKRMLFDVFFLVVFQMSVMGGSIALMLYAFPVLLLGNILDIIFQLKFKWGGSVMTYLQDHWSKLDVLVNFGLLSLLVWEYVCRLTGTGPADAFNLRQLGIRVEYVVPAAFAVLVWSRALGLMTPLSSKLGAMLYILRRAAEEVGVLVPVVLALMVGFGTTLTVAYHTVEPKYGNLFSSMRMLVTSGDLRLSEFDSNDNPFLAVWGQAVLCLYVAVVNILIMSLLVAVITHAYNPESVKAHAVVMQAGSTFHYDFHVRHALACSPVNLLQLALAWLPQGFRARVLPAACLKWWVIPLDGYVPEPIAGAPPMLLATGPSEVVYLAFMFLMYPLFSVTGLVLLAAYAPFGMLHFAYIGHQMWLDTPRTGNSTGSIAAAGPTLTAAAAASAPKALRSRASIDSTSSVAGANRTALHQQYARSSLDAAQKGRKMSFLAVKPLTVPERASSSDSASPAGVHRKSLLHQSSIVRIASVQRGTLYGAKQLLWRVCTMLLAAVIGAAAYIMLLVVVVLALLWAWVTRTLFSLYCIFIPSAADSNCCLKLTRDGDFWGVADVRDAFASAKLSVTHAQLQNVFESAGSSHEGDASCSVGLPHAVQLPDAGVHVSYAALEHAAPAPMPLAAGAPTARTADPVVRHANSSSNGDSDKARVAGRQVGEQQQQLIGEVGWGDAVLKLTEDGGGSNTRQ